MMNQDYEYHADEVIAEETLTEEEMVVKVEKIRQGLVDALGRLASDMATEAVQARDRSGVERRWEEDLANFYGTDLDAAPATVVDRATKETKTEEELPSRSMIGVNITRPKTNAAHARLIEMATPTDERNFMLKVTPVPELAVSINDTTRIVQNGQPLMKDGKQLTGGDLAKQEMEQAERAAASMQRVIDDQLTETNWTGELRSSIRDMCIYGTGIVVGPMPKKVITRKWMRTQAGGWELQITEDYKPHSWRLSPLDFFPDPAGRGEMKNCRYGVMRVFYNDKTLREVKGSPGSIDSRIDDALKSGPRTIVNSNDPNQRRYIDGDYFFDDKILYEAYIVVGHFPRRAIEAAGVEVPENLGEMVPACVMLVNNQPVKAFLNPSDSGELPFDMQHYERIDNQPWGVGVPFIIRNPQRVVRAAWRMVMENAAQNVGGQIIVNRSCVQPANGSWKMTGRKVWYLNQEKGQIGTVKVEDVFGFFNPESRIDHMLKIIEFAMKFAEDETSLPALLEGSRGNAPDTVGGMKLLDSRANEVLMRLVRQNDDDCIKRHVTRYYDWNMQHNPDASIKGDNKIVPLSASAMMAKTIEADALQAVGVYVMDPRFTKFHKRQGYDWLRKVYKLNRIDPEDVMENAERVDAILKAESERPPPVDPRIAVAQMNQQTAAEKIASAERVAVADLEHDKNVVMLEFEARIQEMVEASRSGDKKALDAAKGRMAELLVKESGTDRRFASEIALKLSPKNETNEGI